MKNFFVSSFLILAVLYVIVCILLYLYQEKLMFFPQKLDKDYRFKFSNNFEEINIKASDGVVLNSVLFKADSSKGVIFYLHGNAGALDSWGEVAKTYTDLGYDVFLPDYRGYGKSEGTISSESRLFEDMQMLYDSVKTQYDESRIIVLGYSIGTGVATKIASANHPKRLILEAPFYNMTDLVKHIYPIVPGFLVKYKFRTDKYIQKCSMPIIIFHGRQDEVIYVGSSIKLKPLLKASDKMIILDGVGHVGISTHPRYLYELRNIL